jgi:hypothetical protein
MYVSKFAAEYSLIVTCPFANTTAKMTRKKECKKLLINLKFCFYLKSLFTLNLFLQFPQDAIFNALDIIIRNQSNQNLISNMKRNTNYDFLYIAEDIYVCMFIDTMLTK